ncbi:MAG: ATP-dependent DNA ligase [Actinomycetota bacterium]
MQLPVTPPIKPMLAKAIDGVPESGDLAFEPKWDGFRCIVFRDGDEIHLGSRNERPLTRYFPELIEPLQESLPDQCVVDGEIIVRIGDHLGFDALQQRIHPAESRVNRLATETPAEFVVFDVLAVNQTSLMDEPFRDRRTILETIGAGFEPPIHLIPSTLDRAKAHAWYVAFEGAGLDGLIAKPRDGTYQPNKRSQFKVKHTRTADVVVAGYRMHKDGNGVGSLLVGLHPVDETGRVGRLQHMGVASSFKASMREQLMESLAPYITDDPNEHPWGDWMIAEAHEDGLMPGAPHRWSGGRDTNAWVPMRCELVAEVKYEAVLNGRFRGTTRWVRWRGDRDPSSCTYDQLEVPVPIGIGDVLAAKG